MIKPGGKRSEIPAEFNVMYSACTRHWENGEFARLSYCRLPVGAFLVAQRPSFRLEFGVRLGKALLPLAWRYVSNRMPPEDEATWRAAEKRGQGDEWLRDRSRGESRL